jgi:exodeoxyribonuclease V beta subunit
VALTRARYATWVGWGLCKEALKSPMGWLLHRDAQGEPPAKLTQALVDRALDEWRARAPGAVVLLSAAEPPPSHALPGLRFADSVALPPARVARRALDRDWWVYSFSQLARQDDGALPGGAEDEAEPVHAVPSRLSGTRFGNALHTAFERVDFAAWRDWRGLLPPPGQLEPLQAGLREQGFTSDDDQAQGVPLLTHLVAETLNVVLPEGVRLADVPASAQAIEMEFHLALAPVGVPALLDLLHAHGILPARRGFGLLPRLEGLLTGRMDLVYQVDGACYVLDYKSNQLPDYGRDAMARAVHASEYDLQYVIYTLALHRWLRFRLGDDYDMARNLGGVRYLFCRGLDRDDRDMPGVHALRLPDALVLALDALFAPQARA